MEIREAKLTDRDSIIGIDHIAQHEPERIQFIDRVLQSATCLVAEQDGAIVAYAVMEYNFYDNGFVSMVYVAKSERRRRIGQALMQALASRCKTQKLFTSTNQSNKPMQQLLMKLGYRESGIINNLDPDDPELVYFLGLSKNHT